MGTVQSFGIDTTLFLFLLASLTGWIINSVKKKPNASSFPKLSHKAVFLRDKSYNICSLPGRES